MSPTSSRRASRRESCSSISASSPKTSAGGFGAINFGAVKQSYASGAVTGGDNSLVGGFAAINVGVPANVEMRAASV